MTVNCDYCQQPARLVGGEVVYPHLPHLHDRRFWNCAPCGAYVGCHDGTNRPLGRLANTDLRLAKMAAHAAFDPRWRNGSQRMSRTAAYRWLAKQLKIEFDDCHIGLFDVATCRRVVEICERSGKGEGK